MLKGLCLPYMKHDNTTLGSGSEIQAHGASDA